MTTTLPLRSREWQALGFDAHSFLATPDQLFMDVTNNDYHLKPTGPAVDAGTTLTAVTDDLEGMPRPQGNGYDLGCYEASTTPTRFPDVPRSYWAYNEIEACAVAGIVAGDSQGKYQPTGVVNRDAMAVFVSRAGSGRRQQRARAARHAPFSGRVHRPMGVQVHRMRLCQEYRHR